MEMNNPVLVTTSLVIDEPDSERQAQIRDVVYDRLQRVLREAFADLPSVAVVGSVQYAPLNDPDSNCGRCVRCGCWTTDWTKPESYQGLPNGRMIEGGLTCDQCECHAGDPPAR